MALGVGLLLLSLDPADGLVTGWQLAPGLVVCGFGIGLLITLLFDIVLAGVSLSMVGSASGVLNANQQLGAAAGVAVLGTVFFGLFDAGDAQGAMHVVLWLTLALVLLTAALAYLLPRHARPEDARA